MTRHPVPFLAALCLLFLAGCDDGVKACSDACRATGQRLQRYQSFLGDCTCAPDPCPNADAGAR